MDPQHPSWLTEQWLQLLQKQKSILNLADYPAQVHLGPTWQTSQQALPQGIIYYFLTGDALFSWQSSGDCSQQPVHCSIGAGSLIVVPAGLSYQMQSGELSQRHFFRVRFSHPVCQPEPLVVRNAFHHRGLIQALADEASHDDNYHAQRSAALLVALLSGIVRGNSVRGAQPDGLSLEQQEMVQSWCDDHVLDDLGPHDIANLLGLSVDYCTRLFRRTYGMPPRQWLVAERLRHIALALRQTSEPIQDIAVAFGYTQPSLLGRQFRELYGLTPGQYRRRNVDNKVQ